MLTYEIDEGMTSMVTLQISADDILLIYNRFVQSIAESVHVAKVRGNYRKFFKADGRIREMRSKLRHGAKQLRLRKPDAKFSSSRRAMGTTREFFSETLAFEKQSS